MTKRRTVGKLAQPIEVILDYPRWTAGPNSLTKSNLGELRRAHGEMIERLELLFPHYSIDRTGNDAADFKRLAVCLAGEVFPGFRLKEIDPRQYEHRRGNPLTLLLLLADVEVIKREKGRRTNRIITDGEAVKALTNDFRYRGLKSIWGNKDAKTLLNWLSDARNPAKNPLFSDWTECKSQHQVSSIIAMINWIARDQSRTPSKGGGRKIKA